MRPREEAAFAPGSVWHAEATKDIEKSWVTFAVVRASGDERAALVLETGRLPGDAATRPGQTFTFKTGWSFCERCRRLA